MKISIIAVGNKMPAWINEGFREYQRRFPKDLPLELIEIPAIKRSKNADISRIISLEGKQMLKYCEKQRIIALEIVAKQLSTDELCERLKSWHNDARDVALLIGGPEGLSDECKMIADESWSLSKLTMPHPLVRVILAEALYRAYSLRTNHPYHRA